MNNTTSNNDFQARFCNPKGIYALSHSVGPLPKHTVKAINTHYLDKWADCGGNAWPYWLEQIDTFCSRIANIINADKNDICPQTNLASGFSAFLTAIAKLPLYKEKRVVLMHEDAFASMGFVVSALSQSYQLELKLISGPPNNVDQWQMHLEQNNVLACLFTHVHSNTSIVSDVTLLCKLAREHQAFALVDVAQSIGIVDVDAKKWQVDAIFGSCVKWLCGGPGAGFIYVKQSLIAHLQPDLLGWFSHENPFEFDIRHFKSSSTAKRFWGGTPSIAPFVLASASISVLHNLDFKHIQQHNLSLKKALWDSIQSQVQPLPYGVNLQDLGGSLCVEPIVFDSTVQKLQNAHVLFDSRDKSVRLSMHVNNTMDDIALISHCFC